MESPRSREMIETLSSQSPRSWAEDALLACLERLRDGGPTEWRLVTVHDAWASEQIGGFCIEYTSPWGPRVGLQASRFAPGGAPFYLTDSYDGPEQLAEARAFGEEIADFSIAEPGIGGELVADENGLGWWGWGELPPVRPVRK